MAGATEKVRKAPPVKWNSTYDNDMHKILCLKSCKMLHYALLL